MKKATFIIIILAIVKSSYAQYKETPKAFGDKAFANKDYYEAAFYYKQAAEGLSLVTVQAIPYASSKSEKKGKPVDRAYICYQLAESYRLYENFLKAEPWYYKVLDENYEAKYPLARFWYGICLRANQHFDESIKQLQQFQSAYTGDAKYKAIAQREIETCLFAKEQYQYPMLVEVAGLKSPLHSDGSDYSIIQRNNDIYFTSSRLIKGEKKRQNKIYINKEKQADPIAINFMDDKSKDQLEYGTPSFNPGAQKMYFTRWYKDGSKTIYGIYTSEYVNGNWSAPVALNSNVNAAGFKSIQPFVTANGSQLYFASDKPGGLGGDDIWVSDLDPDGNPINSINLGSTINTPLDEQAPYYDMAGKRLVYSSMGFTGLGGFDFFESFYNGEKWLAPQNLGYPMNSPKDDLYYMPDRDNARKIYLSSDRESDCCLGVFQAEDKRYILAGMITDCDNRTPLPGVKVSFIDSISRKVIKQVVSDNSARYAFTVDTKRPYFLMLEKANYFTKNIAVPPLANIRGDTLFNPDVCLQPYQINKPIAIANVLFDYNKATLRPESKAVLNGLVTIMKDNPKIKVELAAHTDSIGNDVYNMTLSQARAQSCVDYIVLSGVDETRIYAKGYGKRKPVAPNSLPNGKDNPEGRQLNRRTEFTVVNVEQLTQLITK